MRCLLLALILLSCPSAWAAESLVTNNGERFEQVEVTSQTPASVTITHESGVATLPMRDLPPAWQARLGYNPAQAQAWLAQIALAQQRAYAERQAQRKTQLAANKEAKAQRVEGARQLLQFVSSGATMLYDPATGQVSFSEREAMQAREDFLRGRK